VLAQRNQVVAVRAIAVQQHHELAGLAAGSRHEAGAVELGKCCHRDPLAVVSVKNKPADEAGRAVSAAHDAHIAEIRRPVKMVR
jgi:hypothetical protein